MMKKIAIAAVAVAAGLLILGATGVGRKACSFARLGWNKVEKGMEDAIPVEAELARLKSDLDGIEPAKKKHMSKMAEEMVALDNLRHKVEAQRASLNEQEKAIRKTREALKTSGDAQFVTVGGQEFQRTVVETRLTRAFETFKIGKESLKSQEQLLEQREAALENAREQLRSFDSTKAKLEVEVAKLEADLNNLRTQQQTSRLHVDDSRLGEIKAGIDKVRTRIEVQKTELKLQAQYSDPIIKATEEAKTGDSLKEIDAYFAKPKDDKAVVEQK